MFVCWKFYRYFRQVDIFETSYGFLNIVSSGIYWHFGNLSYLRNHIYFEQQSFFIPCYWLCRIILYIWHISSIFKFTQILVGSATGNYLLYQIIQRWLLLLAGNWFAEKKIHNSWFFRCNNYVYLFKLLIKLSICSVH